MTTNIWRYIGWAVAAITATAFIVFYVRPVAQQLLYIRDFNFSYIPKAIGTIKIDEVEYVLLEVHHDDYCESAMLFPKTDSEDIGRLLKSIGSMRWDEKRKRVPPHRDFIRIRSKRGSPQLNGCFEPANAPVVSPALRSDDFSQLIQDILRRKGKTKPN